MNIHIEKNKINRRWFFILFYNKTNKLIAYIISVEIAGKIW